MAKIGLFYGTDTGNTRKVAKMMKKLFDEGDVELYNVSKATIEDVTQYDKLILGTPTLGDGELQDDWIPFLPKFDDIDLTGKTVAIYGLGDQEGYAHEFVDAMFFIYEKVKARGATIIGGWPTDDYEYDKSKAEVDGEFVGLVIDQDNQSDMTKERVEEWIEQIRDDLV